MIFDNFSTLATVEDENAASSFNPVMDLMRQMKLDRRAAILVHHARKGSNGRGSYRGTSKMAVIFNSIVALNHPSTGPSSDGCEFEIDFEKVRCKRGPETRPRHVTLIEGEHGLKWSYAAAESEKLRELVAAVRSCRFTTGQALGEHLGCAKGTVSKWRKDAIRKELITEDEWRDCLTVAKVAAAEDADDEPDF